jgi:hypothetical protein
MVMTITAVAGATTLPATGGAALPLGLAGAALFGQSLVAAPAAARRRPGALSHLMSSTSTAAAGTAGNASSDSPASPRS